MWLAGAAGLETTGAERRTGPDLTRAARRTARFAYFLAGGLGYGPERGRAGSFRGRFGTASTPR